MTTRATTRSTVLMALVIAAALVVAVLAVLHTSGTRPVAPQGDRQSPLRAVAARQIDPSLRTYAERTRLRLSLTAPSAVAVSPDDRVYVSGIIGGAATGPSAAGTAGKPAERWGVEMFDADLAGSVTRDTGAESRIDALAVTASNCCLAVGGRVLINRLDGTPATPMADLAPAVGPADPASAPALPGATRAPAIVSIAIGGRPEHVFLADAANRVVWRSNGEALAIGRRDQATGAPGLVVPSGYLPLAIGPDGLLRVANPGFQRVEVYAADGTFQYAWGKSGMAADAFVPCCNPAHIAMLADGSIVTSEKGELPMVKVFAPDASEGLRGRLRAVVAGPQELSGNLAWPVAADSRGRVFVLDAAGKCVRVYEPKHE